ncbi:MAG: hypothetical protein J2P41_10420, partial [Blastocatellia bacterium]|nr:hypothetical protein [Blastocatellia bacterium]
MNELVIYPGKLKLVLIAFGALIFASGGIGIAIWQDELRIQTWKFIMASWVGIPFFIFCFSYACYRLFVPKPAVIVNNQGIFDNASALSAGLVSWD